MTNPTTSIRSPSIAVTAVSRDSVGAPILGNERVWGNSMADNTSGPKNSWFHCVKAAIPELRILLGLVFLATGVAYGWMLLKDSVSNSSLAVPAWLSLFVIIAFAPPLVLNFRSSDARWRTVSALLGVAWRSTFSTMALVYLMLSRTGQDFLLSSGLVACYFPLLVLQSWLLTRQAKRL